MRRIVFALILVVVVIPVTGAVRAGGRNGVQQTAAPGSLVAPEKLAALFPQIPGWTRGEPDSESVTTGMSMSVARVTYEKGESSISLEIIDAAMNQMLVAAFNMMRKESYAQKTGKGYSKASTIGGFPGFEVWDPEGPTADVGVVVAERFLVKATASGVSDTTAARNAVEALDFKALASLK